MSPVPFFRRTAASVLLSTAVLTGCEVVAFSVETGTGRIVVRLEDDGPSPRDRYRLRVRQSGEAEQVLPVEPGAALELTVSAAGPVELTLLVPAGCLTVGPNPRMVAPAADGTVTAWFSARCTA